MKRKVVMVLTATMTASLLMAGCSSSKSTESENAKSSTEEKENENAEAEASVIEGTLSASDDAASILKTANAAYAATKTRGTDFETDYMYEGGGANMHAGSTSYDAEKDILQSVYDNDDQGTVKELYTKENNQYYTYYIFEDGDEDTCVRYRKQPGSTDTPLELQEKGVLISFLEAGDEDSITYETVGEEKIDGVACVQILIKADLKNISEDDPSAQEKEECNLWVEEESHLPVKMTMVSYSGDEPIENTGEEPSADIDLEADDSDVSSEENEVSDYGENYTVRTETSIYYEDCNKIMDLPTDYEEITESDFLNGDY